MSGSTVEIAAAEGFANAYLARPAERPHPGVLFVIDAYGLRPTIHETVDWLAEDGHTVLAPDVFYRSPLPPLPDPSDAGDRARSSPPTNRASRRKPIS